MSIGMQRWRRRIKNIYKAAICGLPGEMPGYGDPFQLVPELKFNKESNEPM